LGSLALSSQATSARCAGVDHSFASDCSRQSVKPMVCCKPSPPSTVERAKIELAEERSKQQREQLALARVVEHRTTRRRDVKAFAAVNQTRELQDVATLA
jgi:hypothetical protein